MQNLLRNLEINSQCLLKSWSLPKGRMKSDEFSEKFQRGEGSFSIQKIMLQILDQLYSFFGRSPKKIAMYFSENEGGGVEGCLEFSRKFIRFGSAILP